MMATDANPLISSTKASDTSPRVQLHPLVLLTISDYITRHTLRRLTGPIVGAILGSTNGCDITMEVAFEVRVILCEDGQVTIDMPWFIERLQQYKTVFSCPLLELVGWFTLGPPSGPAPHHLAIHQCMYHVHDGATLLLLFHPESVLESSTAGGKLPLTIYETVWEGDGGDFGQPAQPRFRELVYSIETGEVEMIAMNYVAKGGGNATDVEHAGTSSSNISRDGTNGKATADEAVPLTTEDEDFLAFVATKSNAIKMLRARISLFRAYLSALPPSYLTDARIPQSKNPTEHPDHVILRAIQALLSRLPLLAPSDREAFARETAEQQSDVELAGLLASLVSSADLARDFGEKFEIVDAASRKRKLAHRLPFDASLMPEFAFDDHPAPGGRPHTSGSSSVEGDMLSNHLDIDV